MTWINKHRRHWRTAIFILLLISIFGPWTFDKIYVPAEYTCSRPNVRLYGDFCGIPFPGIMLFFGGFGGFFSTMSELFSENALRGAALNRLLINLLLLTPIIPLITTPHFILNEESLHKFSFVILVLAIGGSLFAGVINSLRPSLVAWGVWLYVFVAVIFLILELFVSWTDHRQRLL